MTEGQQVRPTPPTSAPQQDSIALNNGSPDRQAGCHALPEADSALPPLAVGGGGGRSDGFFSVLDDRGHWQSSPWPSALTPPLEVPVSALEAPVLSAWRSSDHVAGWEMGNELFWAKSQEQRGFKDTAARAAQRKTSSHGRASAFPGSKSTAKCDASPSDVLS